MSEQRRLFLKVLREFHKAGVLKDLVLIGSWCHYFYRAYFNDAPEIPLVRTLDLDFLIPKRRLAKTKADIPEVLAGLGFEPLRQYPSGLVKYGHPDLEVEFLVPERGRGEDRPVSIDALGINAQALRFLGILGDHTIEMRHDVLPIRLPEPTSCTSSSSPDGGPGRRRRRGISSPRRSWGSSSWGMRVSGPSCGRYSRTSR